MEALYPASEYLYPTASMYLYPSASIFSSNKTTNNDGDPFQWSAKFLVGGGLSVTTILLWSFYVFVKRHNFSIGCSCGVSSNHAPSLEVDLEAQLFFCQQKKSRATGSDISLLGVIMQINTSCRGMLFYSEVTEGDSSRHPLRADVSILAQRYLRPTGKTSVSRTHVEDTKTMLLSTRSPPRR